METIDAYIAQYPPEIQARLRALREAIHETVPGLTESMAWQMPTFKLTGNVVHFAVAKSHIGLYPGSEPVAAFLPRLTDYKTSKGGIQLPNSKPLPLDLVREIVAYSADVDRQLAAERAAKKKKPSAD